MKLTFNIDSVAGAYTLPVEFHTLIVAGWAGRDRAAIEHHIEELAAIGVPRPSRVPLYYRIAANQLTQAARVQVVGSASSGEVEAFVFSAAGRSYVVSTTWALYFGVSAIAVGAILLARRAIAARLPSFDVLDDIMYRAIAVGFAFFTVATILGALWAADAWGAYWQWDPKETWALIVWLNYAAWLHMRLIKGLRNTLAAWWALVGLLITGFAFLGVNMFLSGLHSYGEL